MWVFVFFTHCFSPFAPVVDVRRSGDGGGGGWAGVVGKRCGGKREFFLLIKIFQCVCVCN